MANLPEEEFIEKLAGEVDLIEPERAPASLKARIYSSLVQREAEEGPLASLSDSKADGNPLCVFEQLVEIAPVGESVKSLNFCRICHARLLGENFEHPPIYWGGCPYVRFKNS